jgi:hypothetical protein
VAGLLRQFPHRPVLPILVSCPLCASWFNPLLLLNHEVHQRHESDPRNPGPSRAPRPGGPSDDSPARERWVPSPHENQPQRGDRYPPSSHTGQQLPARTDSSRPLRSRRKDAKTGKEWHPLSVPSPLCVFASLREPIRPPARFAVPPLAADQRASPPPTRNLPKRDPANPFFASSRLRVSHLCRGMKSHAKPRRTRKTKRLVHLKPSRAPSCPKLILTPRRRARRGWNTLRHSPPRRARHLSVKTPSPSQPPKRNPGCEDPILQQPPRHPAQIILGTDIGPGPDEHLQPFPLGLPAEIRVPSASVRDGLATSRAG